MNPSTSRHERTTSTSASEIRDLGLTDENSGCVCCTRSGHTAAAPKDVAIATGTLEPGVTGAVVTDYLVDGMTCSHCVRSVTVELSAITGVAHVDVALNAGGLSRVRAASAAPLDDDQVRSAVEEAGYTLAPAS